MKQYLRIHYKPRNLQELKDGIKHFWLTSTSEVCQRYIRHLEKFMPKIVEVQGDAMFIYPPVKVTVCYSHGFRL